MIFERLVVGDLQTNCYIIADEKTGKAAVVDPGDEGGRILDVLKDLDVEVTCIINTHGHNDHVGADLTIKEEYGAEIFIHEADGHLIREPDQNLTFVIGIDVNPFEADRWLRDGDFIRIGEIELEVLHTPGHTPGSICLKMDDRILTGDTLFAGGIGRTDIPGGSMEKELESIRRKILPLPDETLVFPGHGPQTTVGRERSQNPFL